MNVHMSQTESENENPRLFIEYVVTDQKQQETQQKSDLEDGFTALSYGHTEPGVVGRTKLPATAGQPSYWSVTYS